MYIDVDGNSISLSRFIHINQNDYELQTITSLRWRIMGSTGYRYDRLFIGLWRSDMQLNEKGYYFTTLMYGLFSVVSLQKAVRDRLENIPVTDLYHGLCWFSTILSIVLLTIGLWNAELLPSEKGFYAFAFLLAMFAAVAVQKNIRDTKVAEKNNTSDFVNPQG